MTALYCTVSLTAKALHMRSEFVLCFVAIGNS